MVLYYIRWERDEDFPLKKLSKDNKHRHLVHANVLCQSVSDATRFLAWYFGKCFGFQDDITLADGFISYKRCKIDSRGFTPEYLMLPGMKEPFYLIDAKSNYLRFKDIF